MKNSHFWSGRTVRENFDSYWTRNIDSNCHEWTASKSSGYGQLNVGGRPQLAHRFAWERANGPIPAGMHVLHQCDNRACVNIAHLFLGTNLDNIKDKQAKGRGRGPALSGSAHPMAKLSLDQVAAAKDLYAQGGISHAEIGRRFGVSKTAIRMIVAGVTWRHEGQQHRRQHPRRTRTRRTVAESFDSLWVEDIRTGCWTWQLALTESGHGKVSRNGRKIGAHKFSYERSIGPVPDGLVVRHTCDNAACVNPSHLRLGTQSENIRDMVARGRQRGAPGDRNANAKLTPAQVLEIRRRSKAGETRAALAAVFGVAPTMISNIARGVSWKHVHEEAHAILG